jgi:hypothetical protein
MSSQLVSRRGFALSLALGSAGSALAGDDPAKTLAPAAVPATSAPLPANPPPPEDLLLAALVQMYPSDKLTPERLEGIRQVLRRNRQQARVLRTVPLLNSDEPTTVFRAFRAD